MSSPSLSVVRLQELKLWQGSYENLLQKSKSNSQTSEVEHLEGISVLDTSNASDGDNRNWKDWDKKAIVPPKPFEQLLEEKLAEDTPKEENTKPKRPFLRKGQGLARFRMGPTPPVLSRTKVLSPRKPQGNCKKKPNMLPKKSPPMTRKGILKKHVFNNHQHVDLSPLTLPDYIKPRGTWKNVFENYDKQLGVDFVQDNGDSMDGDRGDAENYEEFRKSLGGGETVPKIVSGESEFVEEKNVLRKSGSKQSMETPKSRDDFTNRRQKNLSQSSFDQFNKQLLKKISDFHSHSSKQFVGNDIPENLSEFLLPKHKTSVGDVTLYEQKMERELKNFEILEKRVENSSFCSTNTSVTNLLASTPQKLDDTTKKQEIPFIKGTLHNNLPLLNTIEFTNDRHENIQLKLHEVAQKTDVLQQFLSNLRDVRQNKGSQHEDSELSKQSDKSTSTNTSFSDDNTRWSTRSPSLTDNYTEYDTTCQSDSWKKIDAGVNTSFDSSRLDVTVKNSGPCRECEELRSKVSEMKQKCSNIQGENSNLRGDLRELEKKIEELKRDMKKAKEKYEETVENLQEELESERKKFAKEKFYFETYVKESQTRVSKKEREEMTQLKQDLIDAKELLKLKEAKNGATQARLRTQIRQQEREISGLKTTVEKLQRENAKLSANQKFMRRPQEVKMLHEINKNLSKLTEKTFKKISGNESQESVKIERKRSSEIYETESDDSKENVKCGKTVSDKGIQKNVSSKDSFKSDSVSFDTTNSESLSLEKQYEHVFGNFDSPRNSSSGQTSLNKTEKTLPDGSLEVTYSNGNFKVISADRQYIKMKYFNGDVKETDLKEKIIRYHYATTDSWHIQYPDGTEVMEYKDGQSCKKYTDGKTEVVYPDGAVRIINPDGTEEHRFPDGRKSLKNIQGEQIIYLPNGQREIHTQEYKRREYPDGTVRTLHKDGSVETIYANGRVRLKDSSGALVMDTHQSYPS